MLTRRQEMARLAGALAWIAATACVPVFLACVPATSGDRTASCASVPRGAVCVPTCPAGETCSAAVDGLAFEGISPSGHTLAPIAVGAHERVRVLDAQQPDRGWGGGTRGTLLGDPGTAVSFDAASSASSVLDVTDVAGSDLTLVGVAPGVARLRILQPGTQILFDSVAVTVDEVVDVRIGTLESGIVAPDAPLAFWAPGAVVAVTPTLVGSTGVALWDDALRASYGAVDTMGRAPDSGAVVVFVDGARTSRMFTMPVVRLATDLGLALSSDLQTGTPLDAGGVLTFDLASAGDSVLCALPLADGLAIGGAVVAITSDDAAVLDAQSISVGCALLAPAEGITHAGTFETDLHVRAMGVSRSIHVQVTVPSSAATPLVSVPAPVPSAATLGERLLGASVLPARGI